MAIVLSGLPWLGTADLQQSDAGLGDGHGEAEDGEDEEEVKRA